MLARHHAAFDVANLAQPRAITRVRLSARAKLRRPDCLARFLQMKHMPSLVSAGAVASTAPVVEREEQLPRVLLTQVPTCCSDKCRGLEQPGVPLR